MCPPLSAEDDQVGFGEIVTLVFVDQVSPGRRRSWRRGSPAGPARSGSGRWWRFRYPGCGQRRSRSSVISSPDYDVQPFQSPGRPLLDLLRDVVHAHTAGAVAEPHALYVAVPCRTPVSSGRRPSVLTRWGFPVSRRVKAASASLSQQLRSRPATASFDPRRLPPSRPQDQLNRRQLPLAVVRQGPDLP